MVKGVKRGVKEMLYIIYVLILIVFALIAYAIMQLKLLGIKIKDFWRFIEANQILERLYEYSKRYERLSQPEQILYLKEAEAIFDAFDKMPYELWEEEYDKYITILEKYKEIKMERWSSN